MKKANAIAPLATTVSFGMVMGVWADWRTEVGWEELQEWATMNSVVLPTSETLTIGMVEAATIVDNQETKYMANPSSGQLSDETIVDATGTNGTEYSGHANGVAGKFFGNSGSITPNVAQMNAYAVNGFLNTAANQELGDEVVISHAYVSSETLSPDVSRFYSAILDSTASEILHLVGTNNGVGKPLPQMHSHAFNNITVGRSDGLHTSGVVTEAYDYPGRQKPEIVNPQSTTSAATGAASSLALFLRSGASGDAQQPVLIKSILLAGANKLKFSEWSNSPTLPLDSVYGAGETNILNSYRIIHAGEQGPGSVGRRGWSYSSVGGFLSAARIDDYTFSVPGTCDFATLSANLSWDRAAQVEAAGEGFNYAYETLADLSLTLYDDSNNVIYQSDNTNNNLEHIWQSDLAPGTYTLRVEHDSISAKNYALAWRVDPMRDSPLLMTHFVEDGILIHGSDLLPNENYSIVRSQDLENWVQVATAVSDGDGNISVVDTEPILNSKAFYQARCYPD